MKVKVLILSLSFFSFGLTAFAQVRTSNAHVRQAKQATRINQGVRSGELTRAEATHLGIQQLKIQKAKRRAKADGVVTPRERRIIDRKQDRASRSIYRQKNDRQDRF